MKTEIKDCLNFRLSYMLVLSALTPLISSGKPMIILLVYLVWFGAGFIISYLVFSGFLLLCDYRINSSMKLIYFIVLAEAIPATFISTSPIFAILKQLINPSTEGWRHVDYALAMVLASLIGAIVFYVLDKRRKLVASPDASEVT